MARRGPSRRVTEVKVRGDGVTRKIKGNRFRILLDAKEIRSLKFDMRMQGTKFAFTGYGWGHGVGMCQWGSRGMAMQGWEFRRILRYYYRGVWVERMK